MSGSRLRFTQVKYQVGIMQITDRNRGQTHDGSVTRTLGVERAREGVTRAFKGHQRLVGDVADVEAVSRAGEVAMLIPT